MAFDKPVADQNDWDVPLNEALDYLEAHASAQAEAARLAAQAWVGSQVDAAKDRANHTGTQDASTVTGLFTPAGSGGRVTEAQLDPAVRALLAQDSYQSAWNLQPHLELGAYHFWVDASGGLRINIGHPSSDTAGKAIGYTNPGTGGGGEEQPPDPATTYPAVYGYGTTAAPTPQPMRNVVAVVESATAITIRDELPIDTNGITGIRRTLNWTGATAPLSTDVPMTQRATLWINLVAGRTYTLTTAALYGTTVGPVTTVTATTTATPPPPPAPTITATTTGSSTIRLTWTA